MPIVKCPKCGEEYDSMYSFHSCKKSMFLNKEHKQKLATPEEKGSKKLFGINRKIFFVIWIFLSILFFLWLRGILISILYGFIFSVLFAVMIYLPIAFYLRFTKNKFPVIKKVGNVGFILLIRKYFLFLIPLLILIVYFLYPLYLVPVVIYESLSQTNDQKGKIDGIIAVYEEEKAIWEELYKEAVSPEVVKQCLEECKEKREKARWRFEYMFCEEECENPRITFQQPSEIYNGYDIYEIKNRSSSWLFLKNLDRSSTRIVSTYEELIENFTFQNIIIILLVLILYYGVIFGINITKRLEKQK